MASRCPEPPDGRCPRPSFGLVQIRCQLCPARPMAQYKCSSILSSPVARSFQFFFCISRFRSSKFSVPFSCLFSTLRNFSVPLSHSSFLFSVSVPDGAVFRQQGNSLLFVVFGPWMPKHFFISSFFRCPGRYGFARILLLCLFVLGFPTVFLFFHGCPGLGQGTKGIGLVKNTHSGPHTGPIEQCGW